MNDVANKTTNEILDEITRLAGDLAMCSTERGKELAVARIGEMVEELKRRRR